MKNGFFVVCFEVTIKSVIDERFVLT